MKQQKKSWLINLSITTTLAFGLLCNAHAARVIEAANAKSNNDLPYIVQTFNHEGMLIQFGYKNNDLIGLKITNQNVVPMEVELFEEYFVLGPGDVMRYDPPNIDYVHLGISPYHELNTVADYLLPNRFNDVTLFHIPPKRNHNVGDVVPANSK